MQCPECRASHASVCGVKAFIEAKCPVCMELDRPFVILPCRHGVCVQHFQDLGGAFQPDSSSEVSLPVAEADDDVVRYVDTEKDEIMFVVNSLGLVDYYVNSRMKVQNLTSLVDRGGTLHLDGTSAGRWSPKRRSTAPASHRYLAAAAVALFARSGVSYVDTDGDEILFRINSMGRLDYYVNSHIKVSNLTMLRADRDGKLHLDGTSAGSWSSKRHSTVPPFQHHIADAAVALFARSGVSYVDTSGDEIFFGLTKGWVDYYVGNCIKVSKLTMLRADRDGTLHLDGTSAGSWSSQRTTTVPSSQRQVVEAAVALFARSLGTL